MNDEIKLTDVRPEVAAFAIAMERKLRANDHKGGWQGDRATSLVSRIEDEFEELHRLVYDVAMDDDGEVVPAGRINDADKRAVLDEAADVGNFAMMVADVCGALQ